MKKRVISIFLSLIIVLSAFGGFSGVSYAAGSWTSGGLTCTLDNNGLFTISGSGNGADYTSASRTPWYSSLSSIKNVVVESGVTSIGNYWFYGCTNLDTIVFRDNSTVQRIGQYAFYNCSGSTYWLNIPASVTTIGLNAFNGSKFNYVTIASPQISIPLTAFSGNLYARFFGVRGSGSDTFVQNGKNQNYDWHFFCYNDDHAYIVSNSKAPTCTENGYQVLSCSVCEADSLTQPLNALGHNVTSVTATGDGFFSYNCSRCNSQGIQLSALGLSLNFKDAISTAHGTGPYNQINYNGQFDVLRDGYVNAKDFLLINREADNINLTNKKTTINTSTKYQTMEGFGASGCWWAQDIGNRSDAQIDEITELLYGESGAGLDIYRYNLGAGGKDTDTATSDWRRRSENFLSSSSDINNASTYNWNADAAAQKVLASVKKANPDMKLTLFCNSPPISLTTNGKGYGNPATWSGSTVSFKENISSGNYQKFANYVANCAEHFIDAGYNVTNVSPINEPGWEWSGGQEGCHYSASGARTFYNTYMIPTITSRTKLNGKVDVAVWECEQVQISKRDNNQDYYARFLPYMFSSSYAYKNSNTNIRNYVDSFDMHPYWVSESEKRTTKNDISGSNYSAIKKVRCSEYCQMTNDSNTNVRAYLNNADNNGDWKGLDMYFGLALADEIYQDLTILNAVEWDWWVACADGAYPDALVYYNNSNYSQIETAKRLWVMGNYARFIDEGAIRVGVTTGSNFGRNLRTNKTYTWTDEWNNVITDKSNYIEQTAYLNPDGTIVVVYINNSDTDEFTTFGTAYSSFETYVTDASHDLEKFQSGNANNAAVLIPHKSVTTVVLNP